VTGQGPASSPAVNGTPRTTPGAPTGVTATPGNGQVQVSWTAPSSDGGSAVTAYQVLRNGTQVHQTANGSTLSWTNTGLTNGTTYAFTVRAVNAAGTGPVSSPATSGTPRTTPGAPTALVGTASDGAIELTWSPPASDGGSAITGYSVLDGDGNVLATPPADDRTFQQSGLENGTAREYHVVATNAAGNGPEATTTVTPRTVPDAPTGLQAVAGDEEVALTWTAPSDGGSPITAYRVFVDGVQVHQTATGTTTSYTVTGLTNSTAYDFEVSAVNVAGEGERSDVVSATPLELAGAPTGLIATPGNGQVQLAWTAPGDDGGSDITSYRVFRDGSQVHQTGSGTTTTWTDTGRTNGTALSYQVAAVTAAGQGPKSSPPATATPRTTPSAPVLSGTAGDGQVALTWTAPATGGAPITSYVVYVDDVEVHETADGSTLAHTVGSLINGTAYDFEVAAVNAAGEGPRSTVLSRTPVEAPSGPTFVDVPTSHPFYEDIEWMAAEGITAGYQPGPTYRPGDAVTRQAMSAFMYRLAGSPAFSPPASPSFGDVGTTSAFYSEIEWMADEGITNGTPASPKPLFKPGDAVSRGAMSAFMYRLAGEPAFMSPVSPTFGDVGTGNPFYEEIEWMAEEGITNGTAASPKPLYKPGDPVSRGAMSAFMHRLALSS
jgi:predicted phage tail protein